MPRKARKLSTTGIYHVILRGINRKTIFHDDEDKEVFLYKLKRIVGEQFELYCFCLMDNHVHLLVKTDQLASRMKSIGVSYVAWYNKKYDRSGHLFQDRFRSEVVEEEMYLLPCLRYIHQNPVKAGLCKFVTEYRWSSCGLYFSGVKSFISTNFCETLFASKEEYLQFMCSEEVGSCMEIEEKTRRITDKEIITYIDKIISNKKLSECSMIEKKMLVYDCLNLPYVSCKQLARVFDIGITVVKGIKGKRKTN